MKFHPVGEKWAVTGPFGADTNPWTKARPHLGCDFGAPNGTPVKAPADGVVVTFANDGSFGAKAVCLNVGEFDPLFRYHLFAHLSASTVAVGDHVKAGMTIGFVGGWGADGPDTYAAHLHWQRSRTNQFARVDGDNADPLAWLAEEEPVTRDEFEALRKDIDALASEVRLLAATVERIDNDGVVLYKDGQGYDVVQPIRDLNARLTEHLTLPEAAKLFEAGQ